MLCVKTLIKHKKGHKYVSQNTTKRQIAIRPFWPGLVLLVQLQICVVHFVQRQILVKRADFFFLGGGLQL